MAAVCQSPRSDPRSLQTVIPAAAQAFDPDEHRAHGAGSPSDTATRGQPALDQVTGFLSSKAAASRQ